MNFSTKNGNFYDLGIKNVISMNKKKSSERTFFFLGAMLSNISTCFLKTSFINRQNCNNY